MAKPAKVAATLRVVVKELAAVDPAITVHVFGIATNGMAICLDRIERAKKRT